MLDNQFATAEIRRGKKEERKKELERGPMPNVMVALPSIGGAPSVQRRKVWLTLTT